jgi:nucleoside phosphorylase/catechol 2,3-dioxygenase-like lactoylglutathione lyase family enzyme
MAEPHTVVLISANSEWRAVKEILIPTDIQSTPMGETFTFRLLAGSLDTGTRDTETRFFHGGWGKISAAATAQYVIDHYQPDLLVNLGTCGGFEGRIERGTIILVTRTIVYDIFEQMADAGAAIEYYSTELDLSWLADNGPRTIDHAPSSAVHRPSSMTHRQSSIVRGLIVSADRDIIPANIPLLVEKYGAVAADWESGAIAWVAKKNGVRCLILRGVTDLVSTAGGEAYGDIEIFHENTRKVMQELIEHLPDWLSYIQWPASEQIPLFNKVDCIRLYVPDLESGLAFYRDRLGHALIWRTAVAAGLRMPGTDAELVIQTERQGQEVDLTVDSADEAAQYFVEAGGILVEPPFDIQIGRGCVVRDPWANQLVLLDFSKGMLATDEEGNVME